MYSPRKDFESVNNAVLGPFLKQHGFTRFKTRNFIRITNDYILQIINFQKSAGFTYYINLSSYPLSGVHSSLFVEGGIRIQELDIEKPTEVEGGRFAFGTEFMARENLKGILDYLNSSVMSWFNLTGQCQTFCDYEERSHARKHGQLRPILNRVGNEMFYAFLLLQSERYPMAKEYLEHLKDLIGQGKKYLEKSLDQINFLLTALEQVNMSAINETIKSNIETNLQSMALTKIKIHSVTPTTYDQYLSDRSVGFDGLEGMGPEDYFQILDSDMSMFDGIKKQLLQEHEVIEISAVRFRIPLNRSASFHFVYNAADYVKNDNHQIIEYYKKKGIDLVNLADRSSRIEFWRDFSNDVPVGMTGRLLKMISQKFATQIYIPGVGRFVKPDGTY